MLVDFYKSYNFFDYYTLNNPLDNNFISKIFQITSNLDFSPGLTNDPYKRNSQIKWIPYNSTNLDLFRFLNDIIKIANENHFNFSLTGSTDAIQYTEYYSNINGKYDWHQDDIYMFDAKKPTNYLRKLSLTIQLSDPNEYEGGDLEIYWPHPEIGEVTKIPKEKGKIIVFPSYLWHRVTPVTKGVRKSLVWWVGGSPFR